MAWAAGVAAPAVFSAETTYQHIYQAVFADVYRQRPTYAVSTNLFGESGDSQDNQLLGAARRSLTLDVDLYDFPQGRKLLSANGICFAGRWRITQTSPYAGLLSSNTDIPAIIRGSVLLGGTQRDDKRAFGLAIKLFPVSDPNESVSTVNVFVMDTMSGERRRRVLDAVLDNEPDLGGLPALRYLGAALRLRADFNAADRELSPGGPVLNYRPVGHLVAASQDTDSVAPRWLRLRVGNDQPRVDAVDFRDELQVESYPQRRLVYMIDVADAHPDGKDAAQWMTLGELVLQESVTSLTCDTRLHFVHPRVP